MIIKNPDYDSGNDGYDKYQPMFIELDDVYALWTNRKGVVIPIEKMSDDYIYRCLQVFGRTGLGHYWEVFQDELKTRGVISL